MTKIFWIILMAVIPLSCINDKKLRTFDSKYSNLIETFRNKQLTVFSFEGNHDTIVFYPPKSDMEKIRHLERGFYNEYKVYVNYELTSGSYHKFAPNQEMNNIDFFITLINNSAYDRTLVKFNFLGLIFDEEGLEKQISNDTMTMNKGFALHSGININKGIIEFKFIKNKGIVEFKDNEGNIWKRKK